MSFFGDLIAATGKKLGIPELGISEKFGSTGANNALPTPQANITNAMAANVANVVKPGSAQPVNNTTQVSQPTQDLGNGGNGGGATYDPAAAAAAKAAAANTARKNQLKGEGLASLNELYTMYEMIVRQIEAAGGDQVNRINKDFDAKVQSNVEDMNSGMYDADVANAAGNLADSSWSSFDRKKIRNAAEANTKTLNSARGDSLAEVGSMVATDSAKYRADQAGIGRTRSALEASDDLTEIQSTANTLDANKRGTQADMAKYGTSGEFTQRANKVGNYDTSALEATLQSVVQNASASPATKAAAINDLLNGTQIDDGEKDRLKSKYSQTV